MAKEPFHTAQPKAAEQRARIIGEYNDPAKMPGREDLPKYRTVGIDLATPNGDHSAIAEIDRKTGQVLRASRIVQCFEHKCRMFIATEDGIYQIVEGDKLVCVIDNASFDAARKEYDARRRAT